MSPVTVVSRFTPLAIALAAALALPQAALADSAQERYDKAAELVQAKKFPEARKELEQAVKLDPKHVPSRRILASLLRAEGLHEAAAKHLEAVADVAEGDERTKVVNECANAYCAAAQKLASSSDAKKKRDELCEKAILWYRRLLDIDPSVDFALLNLGTMQCLEEKWADAQASLEKFLEAHPDDLGALFNLARCLEETEAAPHEKAIAAWEKYIAAAKPDPKKKGDVKYAEDRVKALRKDAAAKEKPKKK